MRIASQNQASEAVSDSECGKAIVIGAELNRLCRMACCLASVYTHAYSIDMVFRKRVDDGGVVHMQDFVTHSKGSIQRKSQVETHTFVSNYPSVRIQASTSLSTLSGWPSAVILYSFELSSVSRLSNSSRRRAMIAD